MKTKIYRVQGKFIMGQGLKHFTKELKAISEEDIREKIYSEFGSKHRIGRSKIFIEDIQQISLEESTDPIIKALSNG
ncbi:MAG: 50S ribosomal protein L18Ae [Methanobacterium sp.]|nr:50S ribosomal protein L18Ae [Methanobacterium sp.]